MQIHLGHFWQGKSVVNMDTVLGTAYITVKGTVAKREISAVLPSFASRINRILSS